MPNLELTNETLFKNTCKFLNAIIVYLLTEISFADHYLTVHFTDEPGESETNIVDIRYKLLRKCNGI